MRLQFAGPAPTKQEIANQQQQQTCGEEEEGSMFRRRSLLQLTSYTHPRAIGTKDKAPSHVREREREREHR